MSRGEIAAIEPGSTQNRAGIDSTLPDMSPSSFESTRTYAAMPSAAVSGPPVGAIAGKSETSRARRNARALDAAVVVGCSSHASSRSPRASGLQRALAARPIASRMVRAVLSGHCASSLHW